MPKSILGGDERSYWSLWRSRWTRGLGGELISPHVDGRESHATGLCVMYVCMYVSTDRQEKQAGVKRAKVVQRVAQVELDERASEREIEEGSSSGELGAAHGIFRRSFDEAS